MRQTICIIDDDLVSQFATRYCIQQYQDDFEIMTCLSAEEGLVLCSEMLENQKRLPDVIFLDLIMEEMDGWDFVDNLSAMATNHQFPKIYVLSAFVNAKDRAIAKEHKLISGYFDKPLSKNVLGKILIKDGNNV